MNKTIFKIFLTSSVFIFCIFFSQPASAGVCDYTKGQITSISPSSVPYGAVLTIAGSGFGTRSKLNTDASNTTYDRGVNIVFDYLGNSTSRGGVSGFRGTNDYEDYPQNSKVLSWADNKIEIKILDDFESGFLGVINGSVTGKQQALDIKLGAYITVFNYQKKSDSHGVLFYELVQGNEAYELCASPFYGATFTYSPSCSADTWSCGEWGQCALNGTQTKNCSMVFDCPFASTPSPTTNQTCTFIPPICTYWSYTNWGNCSLDGHQTRSTLSSDPNNCTGGNPILSQSCVYIPTCTSWTYSDWSICTASGQQTRTTITALPTGCTGGNAVLIQSCTPPPTCAADTWSCGDWSSCSAFGSQTRTCTKTFDCPAINTVSPFTSQNCTPPRTYYEPPKPSCFDDTWACADWGSCSPQGIQTRSCKRTYDCPSAETSPPATSQYCEASNRSTNPPATENESTNVSTQDVIIKATVKLLCPLSNKPGWVSQGSGTIIDSSGQILTNKHVITGTPGCLVGFIDSADSEPYFGDRQIADIIKVSSGEDMALLRLRNSNNKQLSFIDIKNSKINNTLLGKILTVYGYPSLAGSRLTYSSGDFSGFFDANYLKTTAFIEHGNSGGGSYLKNGQFIGIPSAGIKGELNSIGLILSVNVINSWLGNSKTAYSQNSNNNYSRVSSVYDGINLDDLKFFNASSATVAIYSDKTKSTLLPNNPGTIQTFNRPLFKINNADGVVGYYVYFGTNVKADPVKKGYFTKKVEYLPPVIKQKNTYYFILRVKDKNGNISEPVITEYRYKK